MPTKDPTAAKREAAYVKRRQKAGLVRLCVWVPADRAADLRAVAAEMRGILGNAAPDSQNDPADVS